MKQIIHLIFVDNPLFICEMQFLLPKFVWSASRCNWSASKCIMMMSYWQEDCDQIITYYLPLRIKFTEQSKCIRLCRYVSFCIQLNASMRRQIANSYIFVIFLCCFFYDMSQSTFSDQIRTRPLTGCLICAE